MRWAHLTILIQALTHVKCAESNEVNSPQKTWPNLDSNLRRALLKALTELENEKTQEIDAQDKTVEKASAAALSFYASTASPSRDDKASSTTEAAAAAKALVVVQKSHGLRQKPLIVNETEQIITSASSSFTSKKFSSDQSPNLVSNEAKAATKYSRLPRVETTTAATTTTSTEESEAEVEDVQFFSAPLVAAFTVHQDERGLPKSVEPIYRSKIEQHKSHKSTTQQPAPQQQEQLQTQLALQEKQKALEAEILRLKQQQQQQNYLIRQQQILHQQQLQLQQQQQNGQNFFPATTNSNFNVQHTTQKNEFNRNNSGSRGSLVSFQPSISFTSHQYPSGVLPFNAQQLPLKSAIDFRSPFTSTDNFRQFNYLSHQQPPLEGAVSTFSFLPTIPPQLTLTAPKHHRVFRQESNTGNAFGNFNPFNQVIPHQQSNRFFGSSTEIAATIPHYFNRIQPPVVNQQLNQLLYNSGLIRGKKQQEDLNIVSKVLSLNHYGGDYKFDGSNITEQKVPAPDLKKV